MLKRITIFLNDKSLILTKISSKMLGKSIFNDKKQIILVTTLLCYLELIPGVVLKIVIKMTVKNNTRKS